MDVHTKTETRLVSYRLGLLDAAAHRAVEAHLATCEACRALEEDIAETLREGAGADRHLSPAMLAVWPRAVITLAGVERRAVARHLRRCSSCQEDLHELGYPLVLAETSRIEAVAAHREPGWLERMLSALAWLRLEPLPIHIPRGPGTDSREQELWRGLDRYAARDYRVATEHLERAAAANPDVVEPHVYAGSAHLLLGRPEAAIPVLEHALAVAGKGSRAESESRWQLVHALLSEGRSVDAGSHLEPLVTGGQEHAKEAHALLNELRRLGLTAPGA
jgi:tetratricopeptide (TPR) repeat protein